ncbi:hypothetical protein F3Y22_tig00112801pilonHSYRG00035 [Hibiscus syriacus]|uniref:Uncharacterized protein n=1 Tax=Hibiscus syriacus TaxID=106335 RepID=A0A6A2XAH1_HIBSY|nr:hypothetical protein F3Y22_tig00112801pilonHSYRG00035 [Hibiscus syriacus]
MGIDLVAGGKSKKTKRTAPKSDDIYLKFLVKLYMLVVNEKGALESTAEQHPAEHRAHSTIAPPLDEKRLTPKAT